MVKYYRFFTTSLLKENYPFQSEKSLDGIPKILKVAFEVVAKQKNLVQEGIYRQNGNMNLILGLKLVLYNYCIQKKS